MKGVGVYWVEGWRAVSIRISQESIWRMHNVYYDVDSVDMLGEISVSNLEKNEADVYTKEMAESITMASI